MKKRRTIKEIERILPEVKKILQELYRDRLLEVILYGSFARNQATEDSDIDVAVLLKEGDINPYQEINKTCDALYGLMLETGELVSVLPISEKEIKSSSWPLYYHILNEGKRL